MAPKLGMTGRFDGLRTVPNGRSMSISTPSGVHSRSTRPAFWEHSPRPRTSAAELHQREVHVDMRRPLHSLSRTVTHRYNTSAHPAPSLPLPLRDGSRVSTGCRHDRPGPTVRVWSFKGPQLDVKHPSHVVVLSAGDILEYGRELPSDSTTPVCTDGAEEQR